MIDFTLANFGRLGILLNNAAIINLTRNVALDYSKQNIRSVCICLRSTVTEYVLTCFLSLEHPLRKLYENMIPM
jgi:NAD(P)-dependent dehydrogenase (short-subunit alcohol dehydrogenase family)